MAEEYRVSSSTAGEGVPLLELIAGSLIRRPVWEAYYIRKANFNTSKAENQSNEH